MKLSTFLKTFGVVGITLSGAGLIFDALYPPQLDFTAPPPAAAAQPTSSTPQRIVVEGTGINTSITPGHIQNNRWSVADSEANHLITSASPGVDGNTIIYGHDSRGVFGPLKHAQPGQLIHIEGTGGQRFTYRITDTYTVTPDDVSAIQPTDTQTLTVYTCTGFANSKRLIVRATPVI